MKGFKANRCRRRMPLHRLDGALECGRSWKQQYPMMLQRQDNLCCDL